jgi:hypothetical protein
VEQAGTWDRPTAQPFQKPAGTPQPTAYGLEPWHCLEEAQAPVNRYTDYRHVLGPVPEVDVMVKRPQGLLNVGTLFARMAVLRSCALGI